MQPTHARASLFTRATPSPSRVLVVDDDDAVRIFVKRILDEDGYAVDASATGPDALTRIHEGQTYDLVVVDVCMPEMSGPQLVARMRQRGSQAKVLYVTGYADQLFDERDDHLWADEAFVDKPCTVQGLREAVSLLLHGQIGGSTASKTSMIR
jgi:two-component system cell cycle sensor histidine kinase/response regulator CckA